MIQFVMSHVGTDFDGLASMVLAQKLYPGSHLVFPGRKGNTVEEFYNLHKRHFRALSNKEALKMTPNRLIVVDTRTPSRLGDYRQWFHDPEVELHIYDHHPPTAESVRGDQEWVEQVGAAATLLVERCRSNELEITSEEASLALIAIHEETGSFRYSSTTHRDLDAAAYLLKIGANLDVVGEFLKDPLTDGQRGLLEEYLKSGLCIEGPSGRLFVGTAERKRSVFGLGHLATRILEIEGADVVCTLLEVPGQGTSVAARSQSELYDVAEWMRTWGGGGHTKAASASGLDESADVIIECLTQKIMAKAELGLTVADLMSTDLFSVGLDYTVDRVHRELLERGFHSACVLDEDGQLQGVVCMTDIRRALDHELGHAPARSVMTHKVVSVSVHDSLEQVRKVVVERHVGTLPVLDGEELVGLITRTDLLRELYQQDDQQGWGQGGAGPEIDLAGTPEPFRTWIEVAARVAREKKVRLYAVGGFVRDLLLGRENDDLDLMVEGDAIKLATALAEEFSVKLIKHEKYMTACLKFEDGNKLDLATARREVYVRPAALPTVAESKLKSDLYRRDFTINALALRLDESLKGTVVDFFGGRLDLEGKKIRVLHNHSFFDDPTRILRAIRFEQRLSFRIEPHTQQLIKAALEADVLPMARAERLAEELRLGLSESDPIKVLERLQKLKVLKAIHPELKFQGKTVKRVRKALEFLNQYPNFVPADLRWSVPLLFLAISIGDEARQSLAERFGWSLASWPQPVHEILGKITRHNLNPAQIAELLDQLEPNQVAVLAGLSNHQNFDERLEHYLAVTRGQEPLLTGKHILDQGFESGPKVAQWKKAAFDAQRNGEFSDEAGALAWFQSELSQSASCETL